MNRRRFLQLAAGAGVATATMAEVGFFAEFISWVKRSPKWFIPKTAGVLTASDLRNAVNQLQTATYIQGKDAYFGIIHPFTLHEIAADDLLPEFATMRQYSDYFSMSDLSLAIDPVVKKAATDLSYRAAKTMWTMVSAARKKEIDAELAEGVGVGSRILYSI